jgi:hypothetical protein
VPRHQPEETCDVGCKHARFGRAEIIRRAFPGTNVEAATVAEALRQAGADFRVELFPLMA